MFWYTYRKYMSVQIRFHMKLCQFDRKNTVSNSLFLNFRYKDEERIDTVIYKYLFHENNPRYRLMYH